MANTPKFTGSQHVSTIQGSAGFRNHPQYFLDWIPTILVLLKSMYWPLMDKFELMVKQQPQDRSRVALLRHKWHNRYGKWIKSFLNVWSSYKYHFQSGHFSFPSFLEQNLQKSNCCAWQRPAQTPKSPPTDLGPKPQTANLGAMKDTRGTAH